MVGVDPARKAPYPAWQPLFDRFPGCEMFEGELTGRRLLAVWALRDGNARYVSDLDAESFWIELSGDTVEDRVWLRPDWIVNFFDKCWYLLPRAVIVSAEGTEGFIRNAGEHWRHEPEWQRLRGLVLREVQVANGCSPHIAALALRFETESSESTKTESLRSASLLFDWGQGPEESETTAMLVSDSARLGVWPLSGEVQGFLNAPRRDWTMPWHQPAAPRNDETHWLALNVFRAQLQAWVIEWSSTVNACLPLERRGEAINHLYGLLDTLAALEIALGHGQLWKSSGGGWRDRDGEDYGENWASLSGWPTEQSMAEDLWDALKLAWPLVAQDRYAQAWHSLGLEMQASNVRRRAEGLAPVWSAYLVWWQLFQKLLSEGKGNAV